jgi:thiamine-monophosphate kinase
LESSHEEQNAMESDFLDWLRKQLSSAAHFPLGLSDDAALLPQCPGDRLVITTDMLMDGVDFEIERCDVQRAGRKSLAVNLSDLAAMAARPVAALISLALPRRAGRHLAEELYRGILSLADEFDVVIAGGDTNSWDGPLAISITAIGTVSEHGPLLRSGAQVGDTILVTGTLGGSILGKHFDFQPRVNEALLLSECYTLHAGMDISDGLSLDLARLARESRCGAVLEIPEIPVSTAAQQLAASSNDGRTALDHALADGEDFELLLAVPPAEAERLLADQPLKVQISPIGHFIEPLGLWQSTGDGALSPLSAQGYEHPL